MTAYVYDFDFIFCEKVWISRARGRVGKGALISAPALWT
jgi:hypothetical protein